MGREKRICQGKQHFSHPHILKLINQAESETLTCNVCERPNITNCNFYGCNTCQYFLHEKCLNAPRFLNHSSHPFHHLTLLPVPTYTNRSFTCKACDTAGNGCSFSCACCDFDIHIQCALLPQTVFQSQHPHHELELIFESPFDDDADDENTVFVCDVCHDNVDLNYWLYYCADCDFGAHIECAISKSVGQLQEHPKLLVNKPRENPVVIRKTEEVPIKIQEEEEEEEEEEETDEEEETEEEEEEEVETEEEEEAEVETEEVQEEEEEEVETEEEEEEEDEDKKQEEEEVETEEEDEEEEDEKEEEEKLKIPRSIVIDKHPHELELYFGSPYEDKDILFVCDVCNIIMETAESLYYCSDCDFMSHLHCASPDAGVLPSSHQHQISNAN